MLIYFTFGLRPVKYFLLKVSDISMVSILEFLKGLSLSGHSRLRTSEMYHIRTQKCAHTYKRTHLHCHRLINPPTSSIKNPQLYPRRNDKQHHRITILHVLLKTNFLLVRDLVAPYDAMKYIHNISS